MLHLSPFANLVKCQKFDLENEGQGQGKNRLAPFDRICSILYRLPSNIRLRKLTHTHTHTHTVGHEDSGDDYRQNLQSRLV